jgi:ubiquinone/menaquinone biosynthesis C-methylase UbiE
MRVPPIYVCPVTREPLTLAAGTLTSTTGRSYPVIDGIPHLVVGNPPTRPAVGHNRQYYESVGAVYDEGMNWLFHSFHEDEAAVRERMVDLLDPRPESRILEVGAGTCRDSLYIARRLSPIGRLFITDLSPEMLAVGRHRVEKAGLVAGGHPSIEFAVADVTALPFPDGYFDAAYHFGGANLFPDKFAAFRELARVVRVGGKVVVGDEGLPPWLLGTEFGNVLTTSNPLYAHQAPLECVPVDAREVCVRWVLGGAFYLIDFRVGDGPPPLDLDLPIPGRRGGTHRTRYYGALEGIDPVVKARAVEAAAAAGVPLAAWLQAAVQTKLGADAAPPRAA